MHFLLLKCIVVQHTTRGRSITTITCEGEQKKQLLLEKHDEIINFELSFVNFAALSRSNSESTYKQRPYNFVLTS